ncbi:tetratricopeptide repeat protein [bacterium]|nr:MAG: tetratricopeptide repeat protein [bacterium]
MNPTPDKQAPAPPPSEAARELVRRGRAAMRLFDIEGYEQAVPLLREAIEQAPDHAPAYAALAETYSYWGFRREIAGFDSQHLYDMALENANVALTLAPDLAECHRAMAVALRRGTASDPQRRKAEVTTALDLAPDDPETLWEHWRAFGYEPDDPGLRRALELEPGLCGAHIDLGAVYCERGEIEAAVRELTKALQINPRNSLAYYDLAMSLDRKGHSAVALDILKRIAKMHPGDPLIETGVEFLEAKPCPAPRP